MVISEFFWVRSKVAIPSFSWPRSSHCSKGVGSVIGRPLFTIRSNWPTAKHSVRSLSRRTQMVCGFAALV